MRDIIALAKESGFLSRVAFSFKAEFEALSALLEAEIRKEFDAEIAEFRQVMIAAAEEIHEHWQAHCDEEGYGPQNLMYRLENGIATNYPGYSAGAFQTLTAQNAKLMEALEGYKNALSKACGDDEESINNTLESVGAITPQPENREGK